MRINSLFLAVLLLMFLSCAHPKARQPISYATGNDQSASIAFNRKLYAGEEQMIKCYIEQDTLHNFKSSEYGYWYAYLSDESPSKDVPKTGDFVTFKYNVSNFNGVKLYSEEELGVQSYHIEQEAMIQGVEKSLKQMGVGEKILLLLPSHTAYAYHGDEKKIGSNTPIIVELELLSLEHK